jgi:hypothetical protein
VVPHTGPTATCGYVKVEGGLPLNLAYQAQELLVEFEDLLVGIHCLDTDENSTFWSIAHLVVYFSDEHTREAKKQENYFSVHTKNYKRAYALQREYLKALQAAAKLCGIDTGYLDAMEILRQNPHTSGQVLHMDSIQGNWNALMLLTDGGAATQLYVYPCGYKDYPQNVSRTSGIPRDWSTMDLLKLTWKVGDIIFVRSNYIHCGPPNRTDFYRDVVFIALKHNKGGELTDTSVITNDIFNLQLSAT